MVPSAGTSAHQDLLVQHLAAWSRHDTEAILETMTQDCVFETSGGPDPWGRRYEGQAAVREAIEEIFNMLPDVRYMHARHSAFGERGVSEWTMVRCRKSRFRAVTPAAKYGILSPLSRYRAVVWP